MHIITVKAKAPIHLSVLLFPCFLGAFFGFTGFLADISAKKHPIQFQRMEAAFD
jgi:hypothetical protein